jgi:hypothetical protein
MVNTGFMWLGTKQMEKLTKACLSPVSKPRHINSIFTVNTPILYIYCYNKCSSPSDIGNLNMLLLSCSITDDLARGINNIRVHNIVITFIAKQNNKSSNGTPG